MRRHATPAPSPYESGIWGTPERPCPSDRTLAAYHDGELDRRQAQAVETHLDRCDACDSDRRRLESLSGCVKAWDAAVRARVEPPPRLASRILREISPEGSAIRQESRRAVRRFWAAAAAVVAVLGASALLGAHAAREGAVAADPSWTPRGIELSALAPLEGTLVAPAPLPPLDAAVPALDARPATADGSALPPVLAEPATGAAFASWLPALAVQQRLGEEVCVFDGRPLPTWALPAYERMQRWADWVGERERVLREPVTRDPSVAGRPLAEVVPLPGSDGLSLPAFLRAGTTAVEPSTPGTGGVVFRALSGTAPRTDADPAPAADVLDLATAVASGRARLLRDDPLDRADALPSSLSIEVASTDLPILVPVGELVAGGSGDRVVAQAAWIAPAAAPFTVRLACRPVSRHPVRALTPPAPTGLLAGPELRAILARGEGPGVVLDVVEAQLRDAEILPPEGAGAVDASRSSLLALYRLPDGAASPAKRAQALVTALGADATGFVATDPSGRFQGLEHVDLPKPAAQATLVRLVTGYLYEARSRSAADAPRLGAHVETILGILSERPVRLSVKRAPAPAGAPASPAGQWVGEEPRTGLTVQGPSPDGARAPILSGLVPRFR